MNLLLFQQLRCIIERRDVVFQAPAAPNQNGSRKDHVMADKALPSPEALRQLLRYEPDTGKLFWRERSSEHILKSGRHTPELAASIWNNQHAGREAFTAADGAGYKCGAVYGRNFRAHRVIWAIHYGSWPVNSVDHIDGCRENNSILNLRDVAHNINCQNTKRPSSNMSGHVGVFLDRRHPGRWLARIKVGGRLKHLGTFSSYDDAVLARQRANVRFEFGPSHGS